MVEPSINGSVSALSVRERGKQRRRNRIKEAARAVFLERGYEAAATREIAERAEVSLGTLFAYAPTKPELLLMIVNDDLELLDRSEFVSWPDDEPLIDAFMAFSQKNFAYWAKHPELARQARREIGGVLMGRPAGPEAIRFAAVKPQLLSELANLFARKQKAGRLTSKAEPALMAELWWCVYNQQLHSWLSDEKPNVRKGMERLQQLFLLMMHGLDAAPVEMTSHQGVPAARKSAGAAAAKRPALR